MGKNRTITRKLPELRLRRTEALLRKLEATRQLDIVMRDHAKDKASLDLWTAKQAEILKERVQEMQTLSHKIENLQEGLKYHLSQLRERLEDSSYVGNTDRFDTLASIEALYSAALDNTHEDLAKLSRSVENSDPRGDQLHQTETTLNVFKKSTELSKLRLEVAEEELRTSKKELDAADRELSDLMKDLSHDLQPTLPNSTERQRAMKLGVEEDQLEMLWFADDPNGDIRIHYTSGELGEDGFGLIILDHRESVLYYHKPVTKRDTLPHFEYYLRYLMIDDPRQYLMGERYEKMIAAQYNRYAALIKKETMETPPTFFERLDFTGIIGKFREFNHAFWNPSSERE